MCNGLGPNTLQDSALYIPTGSADSNFAALLELCGMSTEPEILQLPLLPEPTHYTTVL